MLLSSRFLPKSEHPMYYRCARSYHFVAVVSRGRCSGCVVSSKSDARGWSFWLLAHFPHAWLHRLVCHILLLGESSAGLADNRCESARTCCGDEGSLSGGQLLGVS